MSQNEVSTGIGLRRVRVALRDTDNMISVPSGITVGTAYEGLGVGGAMALTVTPPDPNRVVATGDDRAYHTFHLPPTETPTGELRVTKFNTDVVELITGTLQFGSDPVREVGIATDKQGEEPPIILWGSRQAIDSEDDSQYFGQPVWQTYVFLNALGTVRPAAMEYTTVGETTYAISASDSAVNQFGTAFSAGTHGFTRAPMLIVITRGKFGLDAFLGDGAEDEFTLSHTDLYTETEPGPIVAVDGVVQDSGWSVSNGVITFTSPPADGAKIIVQYEYN